MSNEQRATISLPLAHQQVMSTPMSYPQTGEFGFDRDGSTIRGYAAWPAGAGPFPGLVLIPDVRGLYEHYRDVTRRFAGEGFFAFAIDLYSREGVPDLPDMEAVFRWIRELPDRRVLGDLAGAVRFLAGRGEVRRDAIGISGFCMGGQYALLAACTDAQLRACVSWYGMLRYAEKTEAKPASPLELAPDLHCPYLGLFGADDAIIPVADVEELRALLTGAGKTFDLQIYPGAGHAFFNDTRPDAYRPAAAADGWSRAIAFLHRHLG
jgi:carboxymethylenebutenolidase